MQDRTQGSKASGGEGGPREVKVRLPEAVAAGTYTNALMVQHSPAEFVLDFAFITGPAGQIVARVITSPAHAKRMAVALEEQVQRYEKRHGKIAVAENEASFRVGFQPSIGEEKLP